MTERDERELIGVFEDEQAAQAAAERVAGRGVDRSQVRVGDHRDEVTSLEGEMREEMDQSFLSPQAGFILTKEMAKGAGIALPVAVAAGALLALPFGFISFGGLVLWTRLLTMAAIGGAAGAVFGFILGGGLAAKGPAEPLGTEKGTTVGVNTSDPGVAEALAEEKPIRVDTVGDGQPVGTVTTEEDRDPG